MYKREFTTLRQDDICLSYRSIFLFLQCRHPHSERNYCIPSGQEAKIAAHQRLVRISHQGAPKPTTWAIYRAVTLCSVVLCFGRFQTDGPCHFLPFRPCRSVRRPEELYVQRDKIALGL